MFFRNVFLKTLRDYRVAILGWGIGMGLTIVSPMASVAELKDIKRYEITISFAEVIPADAFKTVEGVTHVESLNNGHAMRIAIQGPADAVIKTAARYPVVSLTSYEPSLEDIFLKYYEGDGVSKEAAGVL